MTVEVRDTIRHVPHTEWRRIARHAGPYLAQSYLEELEPSPRFAPRYLLIHDEGGSLLAALPTYLCTEPQRSSFLYDPFEQFVRPAVETESAEDWFPSLIVGGRSGMFNSALIDPELSAGVRRDLAGQLRAGILRLARAEGARSIAAMYFTPAALTELDGEVVSGGESLFSGYELSIPTGWHDFEEYLQSLPRRRRLRIRREQRRFQESRIVVSESRLDEVDERVAPLIVELENSYGQLTDEAEWQARLHQLGERFGDDAVAFVGTLDDITCCASVAFRSDTDLFVWTWGRTRDLTRQDAAYFEFGYYTPIRYAIRNGLRAVHLGTIPYPPKVRRGALATPLWTQLVRLPELSPLVRAALGHHGRARLAEEQAELAGLGSGSRPADPARTEDCDG